MTASAPTRGLRHPLAAALLFLAASALAPATSRADLIYSYVQTGAGSLDVLVTNDGTDGVRIDAFNFTLTGTGVTFVEATDQTTAAAYLFAGHSFFDGALSVTPPGPSIIGSDLYLEDGGYATLAAGDTKALGRVTFTSAAGFSVTLLGYPDTVASYQGRDILPSPPSVPEPSSAALAIVALAIGAAARRGRRRGLDLARLPRVG